jgi:hypothetical protein
MSARPGSHERSSGRPDSQEWLPDENCTLRRSLGREELSEITANLNVRTKDVNKLIDQRRSF